MFIYKITAGKKSYIGFDSNESYKQTRWKQHLQLAFQKNKKSKLYNMMREVGIDNCTYVVIEAGFESITKLAIAEMEYIKKFNTKIDGLNSTHGGDGMGKHLHVLSDADVADIKTALSKRLTEYNFNIKWHLVDEDERKKMTAHLHTEEVYKNKSKSLTKYWDTASVESKNVQLRGLKTQWDNLTEEETLKRTTRPNGLFTPKSYQLDWEDGKTETITNLAKFCRENNYNVGKVRQSVYRKSVFQNLFRIKII